MDLDYLQENVLGGMSRYQLLACIGSAFLSFSTAPGTQLAVFLSATPEFRCSTPELDQFNLTEEQILSYTTPIDQFGSYDTCLRFDQNLTICDEQGDLSCLVPINKTIKCDHGYHYQRDVYHETTMSEFDIVCERKILDTIVNSFFFVGYFLGSAMNGPLSDWFGRKKTMLVFWILYVIFQLAIVFSPTYSVFAVLRVLAAGPIVGCYIAPYVYASEMTTSKHRTAIALVIATSATLGHTLLSALAFFFRDWRSLQLSVCIISLPFVLIIIFLPESPRWLMSVGRNDEARDVVMRYAKSCGKDFSDQHWNQIIKNESEKRSEESRIEKITYMELFRPKRLRVVTFIIMYSWFAVNLLFYGLVLNIGNLFGDPYANSLANAAIEIVGNLAMVAGPVLGERNITCISYLLAGICCLASTVSIQLANGNQACLNAGVWLAIMGKMLSTSCFALAYLVTARVYPTVARGTGLGLASMAARIGVTNRRRPGDVPEGAHWTGGPPRG